MVIKQYKIDSRKPNSAQLNQLAELLVKVSKKIAPSWSLENYVAVNPYMGITDNHFPDAAQYLNKVAGTRMTLPVTFYLQAFARGKITYNDLAKALENNAYHTNDPWQFMDQLQHIDVQEVNNQKLYTVADCLAETQRKDWSSLRTNNISAWAAAYTDQGQAIWASAEREAGIYQSWRTEASMDLSPEIMGIKKFREFVGKLPFNYLHASHRALQVLQLPAEGIELYLHRLLSTVGGWASWFARLDFESRLKGESSQHLAEFMAILLSWEAILLQSFQDPSFYMAWETSRKRIKRLSHDSETNQLLTKLLILQQAYEIAEQRKLIAQFTPQTRSKSSKHNSPDVQAVFCIDVRSEVYRRNLEATNPAIETIGFAGFFGMPVAHLQLGNDSGHAQCPVLVQPKYTIADVLSNNNKQKEAEKKMHLKFHIKRAWKSFKNGAVSCFSFMGPVGLVFLPKMLSDAFLRSKHRPNKKAPAGKNQTGNMALTVTVVKHNSELLGIPQNDRVDLAENTLKGMSLTSNFAPLVVFVGHGAHTTNNPHGSGLDCGACGGRSGEVNARLAAALFNDPDVRKGLSPRGIHIPESTFFLAAKHNTTTDDVLLLNKQDVPQTLQKKVQDFEDSLRKTGSKARSERALRFNIASDKAEKKIFERSNDWSQVRPEWGLAGCSSFVIAPRSRTQHLNLQGEAFLHTYNWKLDQENAVLEQILTAPVVVASWINLQYYASATDPEIYGAGNKTLHNVVGGLGVLEGFSGDLRIGLPWQSVHDGKNYQHLPRRLNVIIEAPQESVDAILKKHDSIRQLFDNEWLNLFIIDDKGKMMHKYSGNFNWSDFESWGNMNMAIMEDKQSA